MGGGHIGRIIIFEPSEREKKIFEQFLNFSLTYFEIEKYKQVGEPILSLPGLEICPSKRKVFRDHQEIQLTVKEYEILLLLAVNKGWVLTYDQIYEKVWKDVPTGSERNTIGFHICNLREKLYQASPNTPFTIRSVREVGYCFEIRTEK